jgi:hypothetical protein
VTVADSRSDREVLLTLAGVRQMRLERDHLKEEVTTISARLDHLEKMIEAASYFLSDEEKIEFAKSGDIEDADSREKWGPTLRRILQTVGHGMTFGELKQALIGTPLEGSLGVFGNALATHCESK